MTKPRQWPTIAKQHRDQAADELIQAVDQLRPLVIGSVRFTRTEEIRRFSAALAHIQTAVRFLVQAGASVLIEDNEYKE